MTTDRRTALRAAAWTAPVIAVAAASPIAAASQVGTLSQISFAYTGSSGTGQFALSPPLATPAGFWQLGWVSVTTDTLTLSVTAIGPTDGSGSMGMFACSGAVPAGTMVLASVIIPGYAPLNMTAVAG